MCAGHVQGEGGQHWL